MNPTILHAHNFARRLLIEMKFEVTFVESFSTVCRTPPIHEEIGVISDF